LLAEVANRWSKTARHYDHLFDLEDDLAHLSAVIILFIESPGSIAELGAFCRVRPLSKKLIAVIEHSHQDEESFIQDGPVAFLTRQNPHSVLFLPWLRPPNESGVRPVDPDAARETVEHLLALIKKKALAIPKEEKFDPRNEGHCILLIADFVKLGTIVKRAEIARLLAAVGVDVDARLDRYLFLLVKLGLINKTKYGNSTYYLGRQSTNEYIHYALKSKTETSDRIRLQSDLSEILKPLDRDRGKAFDVHFKMTDGRNE
jgi:hypothetical protein